MRFLNVELIGLIVAVLGLILAILALVVGFVHVRGIHRVMGEAKAQADQAKAHTETLNQIERSLSTRLLGTFPEYYEDIVGLLAGAQKRIVVFCDYPAYGSFSKRTMWEFHYHHNLKRQLREQHLPLEITCLSEKGRRESVRDQFFGTGKDLEALKQEPEFMEKLQELLRAQPRPVSIADLNQEEFENILEAEEVRTLDELRSADIHQIADVPLYFWLIDSGTPLARAIFAIPSFAEKVVEYGFDTRDQGLISAFEQMRDRYHKNYPEETSVPGRAS